MKLKSRADGQQLNILKVISMLQFGYSYTAEQEQKLFREAAALLGKQVRARQRRRVQFGVELGAPLSKEENLRANKEWARFLDGQIRGRRSANPKEETK